MTSERSLAALAARPPPRPLRSPSSSASPTTGRAPVAEPAARSPVVSPPASSTSAAASSTASTTITVMLSGPPCSLATVTSSRAARWALRTRSSTLRIWVGSTTSERPSEHSSSRSPICSL